MSSLYISTNRHRTSRAPLFAADIHCMLAVAMMLVSLLIPILKETAHGFCLLLGQALEHCLVEALCWH